MYAMLIMKHAEHIEIGVSGEDLALEYLKSKGFELIARNVRYKWGEIDLVVKKAGKLHFIEVKARFVNRETPHMSVSPEDNMTGAKFKKLMRAVEVFLMGVGGQDSCEWQIDLVTVLLIKDKLPIVEVYENLIV